MKSSLAAGQNNNHCQSSPLYCREQLWIVVKWIGATRFENSSVNWAYTLKQVEEARRANSHTEWLLPWKLCVVRNRKHSNACVVSLCVCLLKMKLQSSTDPQKNIPTNISGSLQMNQWQAESKDEGIWKMSLKITKRQDYHWASREDPVMKKHKLIYFEISQLAILNTTGLTCLICKTSHNKSKLTHRVTCTSFTTLPHTFWCCSIIRSRVWSKYGHQTAPTKNSHYTPLW